MRCIDRMVVSSHGNIVPGINWCVCGFGSVTVDASKGGSERWHVWMMHLNLNRWWRHNKNWFRRRIDWWKMCNVDCVLNDKNWGYKNRPVAVTSLPYSSSLSPSTDLSITSIDISRTSPRFVHSLVSPHNSPPPLHTLFLSSTPNTEGYSSSFLLLTPSSLANSRHLWPTCSLNRYHLAG